MARLRSPEKRPARGGSSARPAAARGAVNVLRRLRGKDHFPVAKGAAISYEAPRGYYIDLTRKAASEPRDAADLRGMPLHVMTCQWGLGCYDRYLAGHGDRWLDAAMRIGRHLLEEQEREGSLVGAWRHSAPFPHTYRLPAGWISGMAQGEGASLLVRLYLESGDGSFADGALRALGPLGRSVAEGGVRGELGGGPLPEEYPTEPASHVLNGAIFAAWGYHDVALALGDGASRRDFDEVVATLAENLDAWDLGYGSRYDLYPHRVVHIAAPWYHRLHVQQLEVLAAMTGRGELAAVAERWKAYARSRAKASRALAHKVAFRLVVPK